MPSFTFSYDCRRVIFFLLYLNLQERITRNVQLHLFMQRRFQKVGRFKIRLLHDFS